MPTFRQKCLQFRFQHPFTSAISGMTGSGKTFWVQSLLQQSSQAIQLPPERIVWCYLQWQPAYLEILSTIPQIKFVKGIPPALEDGSFFRCEQAELNRAWRSNDWCQQRQAHWKPFYEGFSSSQLECNLHRTKFVLSRKDSRSISLNSHYLILFKNPRDKLQIVTLPKQMYPGQTNKAVRRSSQKTLRLSSGRFEENYTRLL